MNLIKELAQDSVKKEQKSSLSIRISIFIAVVLIGSFLIIINNIDYDQKTSALEHSGGHSAELFLGTLKNKKDLEEDNRVKSLAIIKREELEDASFKRPKIQINFFDAPLYKYKIIDLSYGSYPKKAGDLLVSKLFLSENPGLEVGSKVTIANKTFEICGTFEQHLYSFEDTYISFGWVDSTKTQIKEPFDIYIWLKDERATYKQIPELIKKLGLNPAELEKKGGLIYNKGYLQSRHVFPGGFFKIPKDRLEELLSRGFTLICLILLFVAITNSAFTVWNERDLKQIGLLKSCGMSKHQVRQLVIYKALFLCIRPILLGIGSSYLITFMLFYLQEKTRIKYSGINTTFKIPKMHFSLLVVFLIIIFTILTVLLSSFKPAKKSSELSIVNAIKNIDPERNMNPKNIRFTKNIERSLAKESVVSYRKSYRGMSIAMALACLIFSFALVYKSFFKLNEKYNTYNSPYNLNINLALLEQPNNKMLASLKELNGVNNMITYRVDGSFAFNETDNPNFFSKEKTNARAKLKEDKNPFKSTVSVYGINDADWNNYCKKSGIKTGGLNPDGSYQVVILDKIAENSGKPYTRQKYIPLTNDSVKSIQIIQDNIEAELFHLNIVDKISEIPFKLGSIPSNSINLFMPLSSFNSFSKEYGIDGLIQEMDYEISIIADENKLDETTKITRNLIHQFVPKSDTIIRSSNDNYRYKQEDTSNKKVLLVFIQVFLLIIGLSNAYNSFNSNLQARKTDFALLRSIGMQEKQLKKMLQYEGYFLIRKMLITFTILLWGLIILFVYRKKMLFGPWEIFINMNFFMLLIFISINVFGIIAAIIGGIRQVLEKNIMESFRDN